MIRYASFNVSIHRLSSASVEDVRLRVITALEREFQPDTPSDLEVWPIEFAGKDEHPKGDHPATGSESR